MHLKILFLLDSISLPNFVANNVVLFSNYRRQKCNFKLDFFLLPLPDKHILDTHRGHLIIFVSDNYTYF